MSIQLLPPTPAESDVIFEGRPQLKKQRDACAAELAKIRQDISDHEKWTSAARSADVTSGQFGVQVVLNGPTEEQVVLFQRVLKFRKELYADYLANLHRALSAERDSSYEAWQEAEVKAKDDLVALGYVDAPPSALEASKITPAMIQSHPGVVRSRTRYRDMQSRTTTFGASRENADAIVAVFAELVKIRDKYYTDAAVPSQLPDVPHHRDRAAV